MAASASSFQNTSIFCAGLTDFHKLFVTDSIKIHITIAPAKMKIYYSLFIFTITKCIYLKRKINFLTMALIKIKSKEFWRKQLSNTFMAVEV